MRRTVLGVPFDFVSSDDVVDRLVSDPGSVRVPKIVVIANPHSVMLARRFPDVAKAIDCAEIVTPDGVGIVWADRAISGQLAARVSGPDLVASTLRRSEFTAVRHLFYGSSPAVIDNLIAKLRAEYPSAQIVGGRPAPFGAVGEIVSPEEIEAINSARPDVLWVGLGAPKQESWMAQCRPHLKCQWIIGVGAAFDFFSGRVPRAPAFIRRVGCEWLFRLCCEPRRLFGRNIDSVRFTLAVLRVLVGRGRRST